MWGAPLYVTVSAGGESLDNPARGWVQRDVMDAGDGMIPSTVITEGGQHGGVAGRTVLRPGILPVDVEVVATWGATREQRDASYRESLARLRSLCSGKVQLDGTYGDGTSWRTVATVGPFIRGEAVPDGNVHRVPFTLLDFWRTVGTVSTNVTNGLADPQTVVLEAFAASTAPMVDLVVEVRGASGVLELDPRNPRVGTASVGMLRYDRLLGTNQILTIDTGTGTLSSPVSTNVDYSKLSHPGNPSYLLEIPAGWSGNPPKVIVRGGPQEITFTGRPARVAL